MGEKRRFVEVWPRSDSRDDLIERLCTPAWRMFLAGLYLSTGRLMPAEAKRSGASFGYCDADGWFCGKAAATHVGWTVEAPPPTPESPNAD